MTGEYKYLKSYPYLWGLLRKKEQTLRNGGEKFKELPEGFELISDCPD